MDTLLPIEIELGIFAGLAVAMAGYIKAYSKVDDKGKREKFDLEKFLTTVLIGAIVGGGVSMIGQMDAAANIFLASMGATIIVDDLIKAFLRIK